MTWPGIIGRGAVKNFPCVGANNEITVGKTAGRQRGISPPVPWFLLPPVRRVPEQAETGSVDSARGGCFGTRSGTEGFGPKCPPERFSARFVLL